MSESRYLTAEEAAGKLGVSLKTLYAYVSRGLIRSEAVGGKRRKRRYRAEDVRRLKERKEWRRNPERATEGALSWGDPVMESAITLIADGRLYYRGRDAVALSEDHSLEQVAELIWMGSMSEGTHQSLPRLFEVCAEIDSFQGSGERDEAAKQWSPTLAFGIALQRAAAGDLAAYDLRTAAVIRTGAYILRLMVTTVTAHELGPDETVARALQRAWVPEDPRGATLLNRALVLCADHELNVSSFTARCVASAGATPYAVVVAGLAALGGVKHGGANHGRWWVLLHLMPDMC
jgi:citrate synthase